MQLEIPKSMLGLKKDEKLDFEFKWSDNSQVDEEGDIMNFWINGDAAPIGRFNYRYAEEINKY